MDETKEFQQRIAGMEALIGRLQENADPQVRAVCRELVQSLLELHRAGLDRALELIVDSESSFLLERLKGDPLVSSMLILHGLHPDDLEDRVRIAVEKLHSTVGVLDAQVEIASIIEGAVTLRVTRNNRNHTAALRAGIEAAVYLAAPDLAALTILGLEEAPQGFVALDQIGGLRPVANGVTP